MSKSVQIKTKGKWKPVEIDPNFYSDEKFQGLICIEELHDYEIIKGKVVIGSGSKRKASEDGSTEDGPTKKKKKKKKKKAKSSIASATEKTDVQTSKPDKTGKDENNKKPSTKPLPNMNAWSGLSVPEPVLNALAEQGFTVPTPIQSQCLPPAILDKKDIIGAAATGSGKTLAFGIPILYHILESKEKELSDIEEIDDHSIPDVLEWERLIHGSDEDDKTSDESNEDGDDKMVEESDEDGNNDSEVKTTLDKNDSEDNEDGSEDDKEDLTSCDKTEKRELLEDEIEDDEMFPIMQVNKSSAANGLKALILTPTRELAIQVKNHLLAAAKYTNVRVIAIVGGMSEQKQERLLKGRPEIIVATPGRFWELFEKGNSHVSTVKNIKYLVIDEADRMVEKGHFEELHKLLEVLHWQESQKKRQTFLFSATLTLVHSGPQRKLNRKFDKTQQTTEGKLRMLMEKMDIKKGAKKVDLTRKTRTAENLSEAKIYCEHDQKDLHLYYFLNQYSGRTLVFCNSKDCVRRLVSIFTLLQCQPLPLHADMHQKQRLKNLEKFSAKPKGLLLATDVAARGLDIPNVEHVIHFQVPRTMENYIHRSGRTARASQKGLTVMLVCPDEQKDYRKILYSLERTKDLDQFPIDVNYFPSLRPRVQLAKQIDIEQHRFDKKKHHNNWFRKAAEEMDIELDEDELADLGDSREQADQNRRLAAMKEQLNALLGTKASSKKFLTKYPTKMGRLELPKKRDTPDGAISELRQQKFSQKKKKQRTKAIGAPKNVTEIKKDKLLEKKQKKTMKRKKKREIEKKQLME